MTSANDAFALDAQTGRLVWHHSRPNSEGLIDDASRHISRGVAVWHDRVYMGRTTRTCFASTRAPEI